MFASQPSGGLIVVPHHDNVANRRSIIILAARHRLACLRFIHVTSRQPAA
jgi:hypothetical protein